MSPSSKQCPSITPQTMRSIQNQDIMMCRVDKVMIGTVFQGSPPSWLARTRSLVAIASSTNVQATDGDGNRP